MSLTVIERNTPVWYSLRRICFQMDAENNIVATADLVIRNSEGQVIDDDHPDTTLTAGERTAFTTWILGELTAYETATGLTRYTGERR